MGKLENRIALVTGGARGIGRAISIALAGEGAKVIINYFKSKEAAEKLASEIKSKYGLEALLFKADVSNKDEVTKLVDAVIKKFGRLDILINNSGICRDVPLLAMEEADWDSVIGTNLKSVYYCSQAAAKRLLCPSGSKVTTRDPSASSATDRIPGSSGRSEMSIRRWPLPGWTVLSSWALSRSQDA